MHSLYGSHYTGNEAHHSGGLKIIFDYLRIFNITLCCFYLKAAPLYKGQKQLNITCAWVSKKNKLL